MKDVSGKAAAGIGLGGIAAGVGLVIAVLNFTGQTPTAYQAKLDALGSRVTALELRPITERKDFDDAVQKIAELSNKLDETNRLLKRYDITEDNLVPRGRDQR